MTSPAALPGTGTKRNANQAECTTPSIFHPIYRENLSSAIDSTAESWLTILKSSCTFPSEIFSGVMLNLIKNPNITSSHLFRADVLYDSESDRLPAYSDGHRLDSSLIKQLKPEYRPQVYALPGCDMTRTFVRQLIPRNPQLDRTLTQTCHFFHRQDEGEEETTVIYIPHVQGPHEMPFYHPEVRRLAFTHTCIQASSEDSDADECAGWIAVSYELFPGATITTKLERTALRLLQTVHKHGQGQLSGYEKRVHLDQIIPQKRYQDTYARLKARYAKDLSERWVEVTDPGKHVFEDVGIVAYLIELWRDMYDRSSDPGCLRTKITPETSKGSKPPFPGFIDIGCGNGVLVYILLMEGYEGQGFDARQRKTWQIFPSHIQQKLHQRLLVPKVFQDCSTERVSPMWHDGIFEPGTFIISNHADELTAWTPLLAYLNRSPFIAIPCCSHDLSGARFRAPPSTKSSQRNVSSPPQEPVSSDATEPKTGVEIAQAAETGSLKRTEAQKKAPSAYSTLCSYVASLAEEVGFKAEHDVLRIPSTRNNCIVGRSPSPGGEDNDARAVKVVKIIEQELRTDIQTASRDWISRAEKLSKKPPSGH